QFLIESIILTGVAGLIALGMFSLVILAAGPVSPIPLSLDWRVLGLAILFSAVIGVVFGILPARQAAKLDPLAALRSD
ncbi:MAG TPA: ABC transporter permease, partial [Candidatus Paceibacterota bacterium]|nr:ABC transporter permease [Candidatus Paceibacterota bacterium]